MTIWAVILWQRNISVPCFLSIANSFGSWWCLRFQPRSHLWTHQTSFKVLVPELSSGTGAVLDNFATHRNAEAAKAMRRAGWWFLFLPPDSADLNPIEMAFSKRTAHLRRFGAGTFFDMFNAIAENCDLYSPDECWNYFKAVGYDSS